MICTLEPWQWLGYYASAEPVCRPLEPLVYDPLVALGYRVCPACLAPISRRQIEHTGAATFVLRPGRLDRHALLFSVHTNCLAVDPETAQFEAWARALWEHWPQEWSPCPDF